MTACDLDDDGAPELMVSAYGRQPNLLYRNDGTGKFQDQSVASGFASDSNVDYSDNQNFRCWCTVNRTAASCQGVPNPVIGCPMPASNAWGVGTDDQPWRNGGNTFTTWCGDVDGDGKNELYNAEIHHWWAGGSSDSSELLKNVSTTGSARFERPGNAATGLVFPHRTSDWNEGGLMAAGGDLDNDGRLDLIAAALGLPGSVRAHLPAAAGGHVPRARRRVGAAPRVHVGARHRRLRSRRGPRRDRRGQHGA